MNIDKIIQNIIQQPIHTPTKEEALQNLISIGVLDKDGNILSAYQDIIIRKN